MTKVIPPKLPTPPPETITVDAIWAHICDSKPTIRPYKYVIDEAFDEIMAVADGKSIDEIVFSLVQGETHFRPNNRKNSDVHLTNVYDSLTECKIGLFPHGNRPVFTTMYSEISYIYCRHRFVNKYGLPPYYVEGKVNMPESKNVKRPKAKVKHSCPNCGFLN